jgi:antitoxin component YwqK of YwqJK toxin-antitoxin module
MLAKIPYDIQYRILKSLEPKEIITLYESLEDVIKETIKHTNFIVECKEVLSDEEIGWFKLKKINIKLLEEYKIDENGKQEWYQNGKLHRDNDLPAVICSNGHQEWYRNGKLHRYNDLPARISSYGSQSWYRNGKLHRGNNLPAVIFFNGKQMWFTLGIQYNPIYCSLFIK